MHDFDKVTRIGGYSSTATSKYIILGFCITTTSGLPQRGRNVIMRLRYKHKNDFAESRRWCYVV